MVDQVNWLGSEFGVYEHSGGWNAVGGVYIFAGVRQNAWVAYYVGQTDNFQDRIPNHDRWQEAKRRGATHVHARVLSLSSERDQLESKLIAQLQPPLNVQGR